MTDTDLRLLALEKALAKVIRSTWLSYTLTPVDKFNAGDELIKFVEDVESDDGDPQD